MHLDFMRDVAKAFPSVEATSEVTSLRVWHCKYATLRPLARFANLRALSIATFPDDSLEVLGELGELRWLSILHLPRVADLAPLARLGALQFLSLATLPSWDASRKATVFDSVEPLRKLPQLQHLSLHGVVPRDASVRPLETFPALQTATLHGLPQAEITRFFSGSRIQKAQMPWASAVGIAGAPDGM